MGMAEMPSSSTAADTEESKREKWLERLRVAAKEIDVSLVWSGDAGLLLESEEPHNAPVKTHLLLVHLPLTNPFVTEGADLNFAHVFHVALSTTPA